MKDWREVLHVAFLFAWSKCSDHKQLAATLRAYADQCDDTDDVDAQLAAGESDDEKHVH